MLHSDREGGIPQFYQYHTAIIIITTTNTTVHNNDCACLPFQVVSEAIGIRRSPLAAGSVSEMSAARCHGPPRQATVDARYCGLRSAALQFTVLGYGMGAMKELTPGAQAPINAAGAGLGSTRQDLGIPARHYDITMYCRAFRARTARQVQPDQPELGGVGLGAGGELLRRPQRHRPAHPRRLWLRLSAGWFACVRAGGAVRFGYPRGLPPHRRSRPTWPAQARRASSGGIASALLRNFEGYDDSAV